jgi:ribosome-associated translation inhibitor RaiA
MTTRFVCQDMEWTEAMKEYVRQKVVEPIHRHLRSDNFELSVHLRTERKRMDNRKPWFEIWLVLQTFDGYNNQIVRREGEEFHKLVGDAGRCLKNKLQKQIGRQRVHARPLTQLIPNLI